ncbi:CD3324 family protein [Mycoplasmatota bacterium WC44]
MKYRKAEKVLPKGLMDEVQKYIQGEYLYIPKADGSRKKWGEKSGARKELSIRNDRIRSMFKEGKTIHELANIYYLSENSIKKIVYIKTAK